MIGSSLDEGLIGPKNFRAIKGTASVARSSLAEARAKGLYPLAIRNALKAIELLQFSIPESDEEKAERIALLAQIYTELAECYISCENWQRALTICKDLRLLTDVSTNVRLLMVQAIAAGHVNDDYKETIELLRKAHTIEPHNQVLNTKLGEYMKADRQQRSTNSEFYRRAFGVVKQPQAPNRGHDADMESLVGSIERMGIGEGIPLIGYTRLQLAAIEAVIKTKDHITLERMPDARGVIRYTLKRTCN